MNTKIVIVIVHGDDCCNCVTTLRSRSFSFYLAILSCDIASTKRDDTLNVSDDLETLHHIILT